MTEYPARLRQQRRKEAKASLIRHKTLLNLFYAVADDSDTEPIKTQYVIHSHTIVPDSMQNWAKRLANKNDAPYNAWSIEREHAIRIFEKDRRNAERLKNGVQTRDGIIYLKDFVSQEEEKIIKIQEELKKLQ